LEQLPKLPSHAIISSDEEGLWVTLGSLNKGASRGWVKLYSGDSLLGIEEAKLFNMRSYRCFISPKEEYDTVDKFGLVLGAKPDGPESIVDTLKFYAVGFGNREIVSEDDLYAIQ
jgi:hypothetical protein